MQEIQGDNTMKIQKQKLNEASISQLNELPQSPHDGTKSPNSLDDFPEGHGIPKKNLTPPLEPVPAATTGGPPSLTYAPTLLTQESEPGPLQRHDSNEATCDSNSQRSAESSVVSSAESLTHLEAIFNDHVATGMAQHLDGRMIDFEEDQEPTPSIDLLLTREEASSLKLNDEVTAVLYNDLISALPFANDDDDPPYPPNSTSDDPDRRSPPPLQQEPSTCVDGTSNLLAQDYKSASMTDAVQDTHNYGNGIGSDDLRRRKAVENARQERIIRIALFTQLTFYGILLTLLMVQSLRPGLLIV